MLSLPFFSLFAGRLQRSKLTCVSDSSESSERLQSQPVLVTHHMLLPSIAQRLSDYNSVNLWIPTIYSAFNLGFLHSQINALYAHSTLTRPVKTEQSKSFPIDFCLSLCWSGHWGVFHKALFITCVLL